MAKLAILEWLDINKDDNEERLEQYSIFNKSIGKKIKSIVIKEHTDGFGSENSLVFEFVDGSRLVIKDDGQSCCERRFLHTDDDLEHYINSKLLDIEISDGPDGGYEDSDNGLEILQQQFMKVKTTVGVFTVVNYNYHNGYYGGFDITLYDE